MAKTIKLTMAEAVVKFLINQFTEIEGRRAPLFPGAFAIFGHGNVTCLAGALERAKDRLPTWRGQNEQSMALAAIAFAKAKKRRQIMIATSSIGPGATNMVTAAGVAHSNRLPILILSGDVFTNRRPDPVLQQVEHFSTPTTTVNDAFRSVSRYWDRITHPEQIISSLPQAVATMLDPADCGPAFLGLCQDTQEISFDYPEEFFVEKLNIIPRPRPDLLQLQSALEIIKNAKKPLIISGGGVRYSGAENELSKFAKNHGVPITETIAGKGSVTHDHEMHVGPIGTIGSSSANSLAAEADVIIAVGTRLQDFTTGSWTAFSRQAKFVSLNTARWDATKHQSQAVIGDALETLKEINGNLFGDVSGLDGMKKEITFKGSGIDNWSADPSWSKKANAKFKEWDKLLSELQTPTNARVPTYAQVVGVVNQEAGSTDTLVAAAGGLPGEVAKGWRVKKPHTFDCEFGFSCMGYEIAGGWGHAIANNGEGTPIVMIGDGSYLMMNSDIYSTVLTGHKIIVIVCDNGGFAVINRLQNFKGEKSFNNLIKDCKVKEPFNVNFVEHAASMGALSRHCDSLSELKDAIKWAKSTDRTTVLSIQTDPYQWVPGDADWDVGVPETSARKEVRDARKHQEEIRKKQRVGV
ncbi:MAG: 3D-(3,5/4)-trihydroxycyclohexane-1,2-dione acylhydrolase (decyclizing) [Pseudomonadota bacterium]|nr:3D-(3,5/4)-trihydroxycyclohexane-1,2-dione acylhydrolase (decyclizing) [Pseudomonadota bacterium]